MEVLKNNLNQTFITVNHIEDKQMVYANWIGDGLTVDEVKSGALLCLEKIKEYNVSLLLNDNRELQGAWDGANDWISNEWMPQAIQAGLMKFAHIVSPDLYAHLSAEFMEDNTKEQENVFQFMLFEKQEEAEKWLYK